MEPIELTYANFDTEALNAAVPVLVDFWASWCGPCRMLSPLVDAFAAEQAGRVKVCKVNVDEQSALAMRYGIEVIPTLLVFKNGKLVNRHSGLLSKEGLADLVK